MFDSYQLLKEFHCYSYPKIIYFILLILLFSTSQSFANSIHNERNAIENNFIADNGEDEFIDDFSTGLMFFSIIGILLALIMIGAGIVISLTFSLTLFFLLSLGIISTSVLVAMQQKSFEKGFKTLILASLTLTCLLFFMASFWFFNKLHHWVDVKVALLTGSIIGIIFGISAGYLTLYILQKVIAFVRYRFKH